MYIDNQNLLSDSQTVTTGSDTGIVSTNSIDLGVAGRDIGAGEQLYVVVDVKTAMTDGSSNSDLTCSLYQADDSALTSNASAIQTIGVFPAVSAAGTRLIAKIDPKKITKRYLGVFYQSSNGALSTGAFSAFIAKDVDVQAYYANGYTIT